MPPPVHGPTVRIEDERRAHSKLCSEPVVMMPRCLCAGSHGAIQDQKSHCAPSICFRGDRTALQQADLSFKTVQAVKYAARPAPFDCNR